MKTFEYQLNFENESHYWWFVGRRRILAALIGKYLPGRCGLKILDAGCGTGIVLDDMSAIGRCYGVDYSVTALRYCRQRNCRRVLAADIANLPYADNSFDLITVLGVLYQRSIIDDVKALKELYRVCNPGGLLVSDESAFPILANKHNERVNGAHRYVQSEMRLKLTAAGFRVVKISYWNLMLFPAFLALKFLERNRTDRGFTDLSRQINPFINRVLTAYLTLEARLIRHINLPLGTSMFSVAIK